ncbi:MAG: GH43, partial [uncultured Corynebacteriales bacterium]
GGTGRAVRHTVVPRAGRGPGRPLPGVRPARRGRRLPLLRLRLRHRFPGVRLGRPAALDPPRRQPPRRRPGVVLGAVRAVRAGPAPPVGDALLPGPRHRRGRRAPRAPAAPGRQRAAGGPVRRLRRGAHPRHRLRHRRRRVRRPGRPPADLRRRLHRRRAVRHRSVGGRPQPGPAPAHLGPAAGGPLPQRLAALRPGPVDAVEADPRRGLGGRVHRPVVHDGGTGGAGLPGRATHAALQRWQLRRVLRRRRAPRAGRPVGGPQPHPGPLPAGADARARRARSRALQRARGPALLPLPHRPRPAPAVRHPAAALGRRRPAVLPGRAL